VRSRATCALWKRACVTAKILHVAAGPHLDTDGCSNNLLQRAEQQRERKQALAHVAQQGLEAVIVRAFGKVKSPAYHRKLLKPRMNMDKLSMIAVRMLLGLACQGFA
jgi:hypothetical protein